MPGLIQEKVEQAVKILDEKDIDVWLTFTRETTLNGDPILPVIYGDSGLTWPSALLITRQGDTIIILGHFEAENARLTGAYNSVTPYHRGISETLRQTIARLNPRSIAVNTSLADPLADGLTHGMRLTLDAILAGTPFADRLVSAEGIIAALNGRKSPEEIRRIRAAVTETEAIFAETFEYLKSGMSEMQIGAYMKERVAARGLGLGWTPSSCPAVNAGPDSPVGHAGPTELVLQPGQLLHFDFGVKKDGFCSDIQRVVYMLKPGESQPPDEVLHAFEVETRAIQNAAHAIQPGIAGAVVDEAARSTVTGAGFPEYQYATGHQLGRNAHDGGGLLGPLWERYGDLGARPLEENQVFTIEPGFMAPGVGYMGIEEDVLVTAAGAEFLGGPQSKLVVR